MSRSRSQRWPVLVLLVGGANHRISILAEPSSTVKGGNQQAVMENLGGGNYFKQKKELLSDNEEPKYTLILHEERTKLGLSISTYCVIDSIHNLSHNRGYQFCVMSKDNIAKFLGLGRRTVFRAIAAGLKRGLIEKNERGDLRTTEKWIQEVVVKRHRKISMRYE